RRSARRVSSSWRRRARKSAWALWSACAWTRRASRLVAMPPRPRWRRAWRSSGSCIVVVSFLRGATLEEVAVEGELADQGIDLAQRERRRRMALEVAADKLVGRAEVERDGAGGVDGGGAVRAGEGQQPLDAAHGGGAESIVPKRGRRQRSEVRALLRKHRGDLALGRPVDARVGPARLPVIEVGLRVGEPLEAQPFEGRALGVADPRLDLPLAI